MARRDPDPPKTSPLSLPAWAPAMAVTLLLIATGGMTTWLAMKFAAIRPALGDMIVFARMPPDRVPPDRGGWTLLVAPDAVAGRALSTGPCVFDPNEMASGGGSLIVEGREDTSPPRFRVHWSGQRTARGQGDCGATADLTLNRYDLQRLANAAGGFGVKPASVR